MSVGRWFDDLFIDLFVADQLWSRTAGKRYYHISLSHARDCLTCTKKKIFLLIFNSLKNHFSNFTFSCILNDFFIDLFIAFESNECKVDCLHVIGRWKTLYIVDARLSIVCSRLVDLLSCFWLTFLFFCVRVSRLQTLVFSRFTLIGGRYFALDIAGRLPDNSAISIAFQSHENYLSNEITFKLIRSTDPAQLWRQLLRSLRLDNCRCIADNHVFSISVCSRKNYLSNEMSIELIRWASPVLIERFKATNHRVVHLRVANQRRSLRSDPPITRVVVS